MSFKQDLEDLSFNLVIDFPVGEIPRYRVFLLEVDEDEDCIIPVKVLEFPTADACQTVARFVRLHGNFPTLPQTALPPIVSIMIPGIAEMASYIYSWSSEYENDLGTSLFPSPKTLARTLTKQLVTKIAEDTGIPFLDSVTLNMVFSDEVEEYRPGNYL